MVAMVVDRSAIISFVLIAERSTTKKRPIRISALFVRQLVRQRVDFGLFGFINGSGLFHNRCRGR